MIRYDAPWCGIHPRNSGTPCSPTARSHLPSHVSTRPFPLRPPLRSPLAYRNRSLARARIIGHRPTRAEVAWRASSGRGAGLLFTASSSPATAKHGPRKLFRTDDIASLSPAATSLPRLPRSLHINPHPSYSHHLHLRHYHRGHFCPPHHSCLTLLVWLRQCRRKSTGLLYGTVTTVWRTLPP